MDKMPKEKPALTLFEFNSLIKSAVNDALPGTYWIIAEIAEAKCNQKGHCYLELVERDGESIIAQIKAVIWAYEYRRLIQKFRTASGETLRPGIKILFLASVAFHEIYGLGLNIKDIDPAYTLGEMALMKKEVIERLRKEGLMELNKRLELPLVPLRIAVISSPTAAGYGDFLNQLGSNVYGYRFVHILFKAVMQGPDAEASIVSAINRVRKYRHIFDTVVIIRGGGSAIDLSCFDSYTIAANIANLPLPVITGIGHDKDDTVADMAAHTKMKTPTAVAEFLISGVRAFEDRILDIQSRIAVRSERLLKESISVLSALTKRYSIIPYKITSLSQNRLMIIRRDIRNLIMRIILKETNRLETIEQAARLLDPLNVLRRGYSITRHNGRIINDAAMLKNGDLISTKLYNGELESIVKQLREVKESGQGQTDYLFPGID